MTYRAAVSARRLVCVGSFPPAWVWRVEHIMLEAEDCVHATVEANRIARERWPEADGWCDAGAVVNLDRIPE